MISSGKRNCLITRLRVKFWSWTRRGGMAPSPASGGALLRKDSTKIYFYDTVRLALLSFSNDMMSN